MSQPVVDTMQQLANRWRAAPGATGGSGSPPVGAGAPVAEARERLRFLGYVD